MVEVSGINKHFGTLHVLKDIGLPFAKGQLTAVVGPNASGKTTLLKTLLGLIIPDSGEIRFGGRPVRGSNCQYRRQIGYMPQTPRFPENLTVLEVLTLIERIRGEEAKTKDALLERFQLNAFCDKPIGQLSGGTRQKLNAVAAMMFEVAVFICDEPTASLDPVASRRLKEWLQQGRDQGLTIIFSSHLLAEIEELADRVVFLLDGEVRFNGSTAEIRSLTDQPTLERAVAHLMELKPL